MKNELDRQLKAQWEAARLSELDLHIDTEALWQKIARPEKQGKRLISWFRYAAAMLIGAMLTFGLMRWHTTPGTIALQAGMSRQKTSKLVLIQSNEPTPQSAITGDTHQKQYPATVYVHQAPGTASLPPKKAETATGVLKQDEPLPGNTPPGPPAEQEKLVAAQTKKSPVRKTVHLLDLEQAIPSAPKPSKLMMAIGEHTRPKSNDMAFSTRILTKQF